MNLDPLLYWVREREDIRIKKEEFKLPQSQWTKDPILAKYRFCNVRREDDRVTRWIDENIRRPYAGHPYLWLMLCIARQINWPETLNELRLRGAMPHKIFPVERFIKVLNDRADADKKVYTGAYIITAPNISGSSKAQYIAEIVIGGLWERRELFARVLGEPHTWQKGFKCPTLESVHSKIMVTKGWGQFTAYQAVVDMRFSGILENASDRDSWAAAGPGTIRGLNRLQGRPLEHRLNQGVALGEMRQIYRELRRHTLIPFDFSDVPNILCETDKYLRVKNGEGKPRAKYVWGRGY